MFSAEISILILRNTGLEEYVKKFVTILKYLKEKPFLARIR